MTTESSMKHPVSRPATRGVHTDGLFSLEDHLAAVLRRAQEDGLFPRRPVTGAPPAGESSAVRVCAPTFDKEKSVIEKDQFTAPELSASAKPNDNQSNARAKWLRMGVTALMLLALTPIASATNISFGSDPFEGTDVRNIPGRQVVGGELFIAFHPGTESLVFDDAAFAMGNKIHFANGLLNDIPSTGVNAVVLQSIDDDSNPLTPFGAGNAANLLAGRITERGAGVFVYFNSSLNLARLVYSSDLSSNTADLKILARMLNLTGQEGINALPTFSARNFNLRGDETVPEPSSLGLMGGGIAVLLLRSVRRRRTRNASSAALTEMQ
jgi:hypothetical protein